MNCGRGIGYSLISAGRMRKYMVNFSAELLKREIGPCQSSNREVHKNTFWTLAYRLSRKLAVKAWYAHQPYELFDWTVVMRLPTNPWQFLAGMFMS